MFPLSLKYVCLSVVAFSKVKAQWNYSACHCNRHIWEYPLFFMCLPPPRIFWIRTGCSTGRNIPDGWEYVWDTPKIFFCSDARTWKCAFVQLQIFAPTMVQQTHKQNESGWNMCISFWFIRIKLFAWNSNVSLFSSVSCWVCSRIDAVGTLLILSDDFVVWRCISNSANT